VLSCEPVWHDYILSAEVNPRAPLVLSALRKEREKVEERFGAFLKKYGKVAVWGAGHQSFTMLAMLPDTAKISYIVDSAGFKQGRYSPITHIEVVAPQTLRKEPVDALLIMAGSYSDEIAGIAWEQYGQKNIAIFRDNVIEACAPDGQ
jgi:hypothetical protein